MKTLICLAALATSTAMAAPLSSEGPRGYIAWSINAMREQRGLPPLVISARLTALARSRAEARRHAQDRSPSPNRHEIDTYAFEPIGPTVAEVQSAVFADCDRAASCVIFSAHVHAMGVGVSTDRSGCWIVELFR